MRAYFLQPSDMSLELLLGPQLEALAERGYAVVGASAPGEYVGALEARGIRHFPLRHATRRMAPREDVAAVFELSSLFRRLRPAIVSTYGDEVGGSIHLVEAFEGSEYGSPLDASAIARLFPFPPARR